jgi:hypothetical protein
LQLLVAIHVLLIMIWHLDYLPATIAKVTQSRAGLGMQVIYNVLTGNDIRNSSFLIQQVYDFDTVFKAGRNQGPYPKSLTIQLWLYYSVRKLFTGLAIAAFIAWKLIVARAIATDSKPARANTHH